MRNAKEEPDLAAVKAVLKKLQRLDLSSESVVAESLPDAANQAVIARDGIGVFDRKRSALETSRGKQRSRAPLLVLFILAVIGSTAAIVGSGLLPLSDLRALLPSEKTEGVQSNEGELALLSEARRLINDGDITLARTRLLHGQPEKRAGIALLLAQSYDPKYLRALPKANNLPDRAEAERWYRKWHELAVVSGLEMDSERLERIIKAMK